MKFVDIMAVSNFFI
ncbi:unnamed protein product [Acanthoscelides obtectus]|uniref:Uncharacterized protein n=1 Tax=Acanthoscelides obtectus TaxID=200917 RepID=A0A9P0KXE1_ACAOB|nr:unnamed protein product [Acanthoscelides obtectus]CAK1625185.1 hypothetical protein AOBTE_LOCUS3014 [Acanthoscelides obtectus]